MWNVFHLDGLWDFQIDPSDGSDVAEIRDRRTATVPMPWQAQFDDLRYYDGVAWYRRSFEAAGAGGTRRNSPFWCSQLLHHSMGEWRTGGRTRRRLHTL